MKSIYKVTTEGDVEGRSVKLLGYVEANSPEHAVKYLKSIGINEYYQYSVECVKNPVIKATQTEEQLSDYVAVEYKGYGDVSFWKVSKTAESIQRKKDKIEKTIKEAGLTKEEILEYLKDE